MQLQRIGLVGYGEVGRIFCAGLQPQVAQVAAWDLKFADPASAPAQQAQPQAHPGETPMMLFDAKKK